MDKNETVKLLRECDSGVKMGIESINDVLDRVESDKMRSLLTDCRNQHEQLGSEIREALSSCNDGGKDPNPIAKGMSKMKTGIELGVDCCDERIADIMTQGADMGVKSLSRYLNQYPNASSESRGFATRLVDLESGLSYGMRQFL